MSSIKPNNSLPQTLVETVAVQIRDDISRRGLRPGDRYMTAAEAGKYLEVNPVTVNRAMQVLADQEFLVRQRSRGTYVGPKFRLPNQPERVIDVVHVLMAMDYHDTRSANSDTLVDAITGAIPGVMVEIHFVPEGQELACTQRVVDQVSQSSLSEGLVLIRSSRDAQTLLQQSHVPAVVFGQVYPGIALPGVKQDQAEIGRMLAQFAMQHEHMRCALLTHNRWRHGDNLMVESLTQALAAGGVGLDGLLIRSVTPNRSAIVATVTSLMELRTPPTVLLCRNDFYAEIAIETLAASNGRTPRVDVISGGHGDADVAASFPRIVSGWNIQQQMETVVGLLQELVKDSEQASSKQVMVPVRLGTVAETA